MLSPTTCVGEGFVWQQRTPVIFGQSTFSPWRPSCSNGQPIQNTETASHHHCYSTVQVPSLVPAIKVTTLGTSLRRAISLNILECCQRCWAMVVDHWLWFLQWSHEWHSREPVSVFLQGVLTETQVWTVHGWALLFLRQIWNLWSVPVRSGEPAIAFSKLFSSL